MLCRTYWFFFRFSVDLRSKFHPFAIFVHAILFDFHYVLSKFNFHCKWLTPMVSPQKKVNRLKVVLAAQKVPNIINLYNWVKLIVCFRFLFKRTEIILHISCVNCREKTRAAAVVKKSGAWKESYAYWRFRDKCFLCADIECILVDIGICVSNEIVRSSLQQRENNLSAQRVTTTTMKICNIQRLRQHRKSQGQSIRKTSQRIIFLATVSHSAKTEIAALTNGKIVSVSLYESMHLSNVSQHFERDSHVTEWEEERERNESSATENELSAADD